MNTRSAPAQQPGSERQFIFTDDDFDALRDLVQQITGICLSQSKRELVYGRVSRRLRALGLDSFRSYRGLLAADDGAELVEFCNAITTNLTSFFREPHHFEYLREAVLKPFAAAAGRRRLRIWSAGCSTGEEPYSIAMTVLETLPNADRFDIKILATDLDSAVLERARGGIYAEERVRGLSPARLARFFRERPNGTSRAYAVAPEIAAMVTFKQFNLMHELPMPGPIDVIFCRNVVIYFDKPTQRELFARLATRQRRGDVLFLGHSESLFKVSDAWELIGKTIYCRTAP